MSDIGSMILKLRNEREMSQDELARRLNCTKQTISNYERNARRPSYEMLEAIADILNVPMSFLISKEEQREELERIYKEYALPSNLHPITKKSAQRVPMIGEIAAGIPIVAEQDYETYVDCPMKADFALTVRGDSMEPIFLDGDVVYLREQPDVDDGQIAAVIVDDSATLKHVYHNPTGLTLISENRAYPPMYYSQNNSDSLRILGLVVGYTRMFRLSPLKGVTKGMPKK